MKKKVAVVGYGGQGGWHADHALKSDVVELAGIYDIREVRNQVAREKGIFVYDSFEAVLADPAVEIVVVAVPNDVHKELVIRALEAGKNVICEKPVEMSSEAVQEMVDAANRSGKLFTVHHNRRWDVDFLAIKGLIDRGELGKVINVESRVHGSRGIPSDWRCEKEHGGGMILDWGVHLIDQILQMITEKIKTVYCVTTHITNKEVDDGFKLTLTFESGSTAYVEVGTFNFIALPRFYFQGEKGTAMITDWRQPCHVVKCKHWNEKDVLPVQTAAGITKTMAPRDEITVDEYDLPIPQSDVHDFYRNVCKAIDGIEPQLVTHAQIQRVMKVMEAAFASAEAGQVIAFEE